MTINYKISEINKVYNVMTVEWFDGEDFLLTSEHKIPLNNLNEIETWENIEFTLFNEIPPEVLRRATNYTSLDYSELEKHLNELREVDFRKSSSLRLLRI